MNKKNKLAQNFLNEQFKKETFSLDENKKIKLYCLLSYIYILWIIGLLSEKDNIHVRFHVNQGIIFSIFFFSSLCIIQILSIMLNFIAPILAAVTSLLQLVWIILSVTFIAIGIKNAIKGIDEPLPFIGELFTIIK